MHGKHDALRVHYCFESSIVTTQKLLSINFRLLGNYLKSLSEVWEIKNIILICLGYSRKMCRIWDSNPGTLYHGASRLLKYYYTIIVFNLTMHHWTRDSNETKIARSEYTGKHLMWIPEKSDMKGCQWRVNIFRLYFLIIHLFFLSWWKFVYGV